MNPIAQLFSSITTPAAQPTTPQPGNIPENPTATPASSDKTAPNGVVPNTTTAATETKETSPLDKFSDLWQDSDQAKQLEPLINADPKTIAEVAKKTDFSKFISKEQLQAIAQGGEAAVGAFSQALNNVAQGVYAQSAFASTKMIEQAIAKAQERMTQDLPSHVKRLQVSDSLRSENPALSHPAASPILGAIESQLTMKFPNASASEITTMAKSYLEQFANAVTAPAKAKAEQDAKQTTQEFDWSSFL